MQGVVVRSLASSLSKAVVLRTGSCAPLCQRTVSTSSKANLVDVSDDSQFGNLLQDATKHGKLLLVDFTAKWCGPCRMIAPIYERLSTQNPEVVFLKVDIDNPNLERTVNDHNITGVPTFVYYKDGRRVESFSGARAQMLEDLVTKHK